MNIFKTNNNVQFVTKKQYDSIDECKCGGPIFKYKDITKNEYEGLKKSHEKKLADGFMFADGGEAGKKFAKGGMFGGSAKLEYIDVNRIYCYLKLFFCPL